MNRINPLSAAALAAAVGLVLGAAYAVPFDDPALRAYTVAVERGESLVAGQEKPRLHELRVTHLFRKEDGAWKLIHRHAEPLMAKTAPDAVFTTR